MISLVCWMGAFVASALLTGAVPSTATADEFGEMLVSVDGRTFAPEPEAGLFDRAALLVPGDAITSSLWVRNESPSPANLRVSLRELDTPSAEFARSVRLSVRDSGATMVQTLAEVERCDVLVRTTGIPVGGTVRVDFALEMGDFAGDSTQAQSASFSVVAAMSDAAAGELNASPCEDEGVIISSSSPGAATPVTIAATGSRPPVALLVTGGAVLGLGMILVGASRRRRSIEARPETGAASGSASGADSPDVPLGLRGS